MPAAYRVIVLPEAFEDLDRIIDYIKQQSPQNAARVIERLWVATQSLAILPYRYKVHRSNRDPGRTVRSMPVPPFIVYYRVVEAHRTVRVLTVRHGSQRQPRRFK
jgi:plasmid stabilization system protein ParE